MTDRLSTRPHLDCVGSPQRRCHFRNREVSSQVFPHEAVDNLCVVQRIIDEQSEVAEFIVVDVGVVRR